MRLKPHEYDGPILVPKKDRVVIFRSGHFEHAGHICKGKRRFHSHDEAREFRENRRMKLGADYDPLRIYECPGCKGWHVTSLQIELAHLK